MNEFVKRSFDLLERYWHKFWVAFVAPLLSFVAVVWIHYNPQTKLLSATGWVLSVIAGFTVAIIWILTNRLPRVKKGRVGIVIGILCDGPEHDKQVKVDFIAHLRRLIQSGEPGFELVELPGWALDGLDSAPLMNRLLNKVRGHFLLYGRVRLRNKDGRPAHLLAFEGMVRHRLVPIEISQELALDFTRVLPRKVIIERENDAFSFEATSEWTDVSARYIIGMAALISGDVAYAENLFKYVESRLKLEKGTNAGVKEISRRLPGRFRQLYSAWVSHLYQAYFSSRNMQYVIKSDEICSKLLQYDPANMNGMMVKALCEFILRRDIPAAHTLITRCRNNSDSTWWYSRAFLHAYQGKMDEAVGDYKHAFQGPIRDTSVPVQCEEFIQIVLAQEPDHIQLHFCLGLINFHAKQDFLAAERDFGRFLEKVNGDDFSSQVTLARKLIQICKIENTKVAPSSQLST
jgi:hypothetical protein